MVSLFLIRNWYNKSHWKEILLAPSAVLGGKKNVPILAAKTTARPIAKGPPIIKNFSEGAVNAIVESPEKTQKLLEYLQSYDLYSYSAYPYTHTDEKIYENVYCF